MKRNSPLCASWARAAMQAVIACISIISVFLNTNTSFALSANEVLVITNRTFPHSDELADYYMFKRGVPAGNVIRLRVTTEEECSRKEYDENVVAPVRSYLDGVDPQGTRIRCLLIIYGLPLRISQSELHQSPAERAELAKLTVSIGKLEIKLQVKKAEGGDGRELQALKDEIDKARRRMAVINKEDQIASLDSEIALVREDKYLLSGWIPNRYFIGYRGIQPKDFSTKALLVSRLDASSDAIVKRIIDDSLRTEMNGLKGRAYFDARWSPVVERNLSGYALYDASIHEAAKALEKSGAMSVILDDTERVFQPGECPEAALYCGWYSLANYVDAFQWVPGSIGFHVASAECQTLRQSQSRVWCKLMLEKGIAATVGPVAEPYVESFPAPQVFFGAILQGNLSLAECYAIANPFWSWRMVLIGDPLYRPFKNRWRENSLLGRKLTP